MSLSPSLHENQRRELRSSPHLGSLFTVGILLVALSLGCLVMGGARPWILIPILGLFTVLVLVQGFRLLAQTSELSFPALDWVDASVLGFLLYATALWYFAPSEYVARQEYFIVVGCAIVFGVSRYGIGSRTHLLVILSGILVVVAGVTAFAFYLKSNPEFLPYGERLHQYYAPRITGTYGCPNHLGYLLVLGIGVAAGFAFFGQIPWFLRIFCLYLIAVMSVAVLLTESRGTFLGYAASVVVAGVWIFRARKWPLIYFMLGAAGLFAVGIFALYYSGIIQRITGLWQHFDGTVPLDQYVRIKLAKDALHIIADHPWFGTGPGTFLYIHPRYHGPDYASLAIYTHNDYLNLICDYGLLSVPFALVFIGGVTWKLLKQPEGHWEWPHEVVRFSVLLAWTAIVVHSVVDFNLHIPANAFLVFTFAGLGLRHSRSQETTRLSLPPNAVRILGCVLILMAAALGLLLTKTAQGYYRYYQAYENRSLQPAETTLQQAKVAFEYDRHSPFTSSLIADLYRFQASSLKPGPERIAKAQMAADWYQIASASNPLEDSIRIRQGMVYDLMGRFAEASLYYAEAIRQQPYNGFYFIALGAHYWRRGMLSESSKAYHRAAECPVGSQEAREALVQLDEIVRKNKLTLDPFPRPDDPHVTLP